MAPQSGGRICTCHLHFRPSTGRGPVCVWHLVVAPAALLPTLPMMTAAPGRVETHPASPSLRPRRARQPPAPPIGAYVSPWPSTRARCLPAPPWPGPVRVRPAAARPASDAPPGLTSGRTGWTTTGCRAPRSYDLTPAQTGPAPRCDSCPPCPGNCHRLPRKSTPHAVRCNGSKSGRPHQRAPLATLVHMPAPPAASSGGPARCTLSACFAFRGRGRCSGIRKAKNDHGVQRPAPSNRVALDGSHAELADLGRQPTQPVHALDDLSCDHDGTRGLAFTEW